MSNRRLTGPNPGTIFLGKFGFPSDFWCRFAIRVVGGYAMELSRRTFFKSALAGGAGLSLLGFDLTPAFAQLKELKIARATETRSTCPYCSVSCGVLIYTIGDKAKNVTPQV